MTWLNEQVKRNIHRYPKDFMFQLTSEEKQELIANCDHLEKLKFPRLIFKAIREFMHEEQLDKNRPRIGYKIG
jgi:hypothetical protein